MSSSSGKKKDADVLIRYSIMKLKRESVPKEVKEQELKYLNLLLDTQKRRKETESSPYVSYNYNDESEALLEKQIADL